MKKIIFLLIYILCITYSFSQPRRDGIWCFGDSAVINFNTSPPTTSSCGMDGRGSCASISDTSGRLLFYCNTRASPGGQTALIYNSVNEIMENGDSLIGEGWYYEMAIVPNPANFQQYYVLHIGILDFPGLYYTLVDLSYNSGLGKVLQKNVLICDFNGIGSGPVDGLAAIKHGNGRDWWVLSKSYTFAASNSVYRLLITDTGISIDSIQNIGTPTIAGFLRLKFNSTGNKLLIVAVTGLLELYDFDRCSGLLSNRKLINWETGLRQDYFWDAEFSLNSSKLYVSVMDTLSMLIQYDLIATNISSTRQTLFSFNFPRYGAGNLKLAPDNKIYWSIGYYDGMYFNYPYDDSIRNVYNENLSIINQPDLLASACDFQLYSFYLGGKRTYLGLPNNPDYDLPALGGSVCDTLGLPNGVVDVSGGNEITIFPNPASDKLTVFFNKNDGRIVTAKIQDLYGRMILEQNLQNNSINLENLTVGSYVISFYESNSYLSSTRFTVVK